MWQASGTWVTFTNTACETVVYLGAWALVSPPVRQAHHACPKPKSTWEGKWRVCTVLARLCWWGGELALLPSILCQDLFSAEQMLPRWKGGRVAGLFKQVAAGPFENAPLTFLTTQSWLQHSIFFRKVVQEPTSLGTTRFSQLLFILFWKWSWTDSSLNGLMSIWPLGTTVASCLLVFWKLACSGFSSLWCVCGGCV